jgi:hypothetical protein
MSGEAEAAAPAGTPAPKLAPAADVPSDDASMEVEANGDSLMENETLTNGNGSAAVDGNGTTEHAEAVGNDAMETDEVRGSKAILFSLAFLSLISPSSHNRCNCCCAAHMHTRSNSHCGAGLRRSPDANVATETSLQHSLYHTAHPMPTPCSPAHLHPPARTRVHAYGGPSAAGGWRAKR